jgi:hypothetical protein
MKKIINNHISLLLAILALVFFGLIVGYFVWGVGDVIAQVQLASHNASSTGQIPNFDLKGAASIDYRGVLPVASS